MIRRVLASPFRRSLAAALLGVVLGGSTASTTDASPDGPPPPSPKESVEQATQHLLRALELMLMAIPRYAPPEVLENGDIIIRRIRPEGEDAPPAAPEGTAPERTDI